MPQALKKAAVGTDVRGWRQAATGEDFRFLDGVAGRWEVECTAGYTAGQPIRGERRHAAAAAAAAGASDATTYTAGPTAFF